MTDQATKAAEAAKLSAELRMWAEADVLDMGSIEDLLTRGADTIARLSGELAEAREALERADAFVTNGIELGFIRMPDASTPDPAHETPGLIRAVLAKLSGGE
jgi:hypothetical protein